MDSQPPSWAARLAIESGFHAIAASSRDVKLLCLQRFVRLYAYGASFLILAQFLSSMDFSDDQIGLFMTLTLLGDVVLSFVLTAVTDAVGRRRVLAVGALMLVLSGAVFAFVDNYWVLLLASIVGVISPGGNEIGPFRAIEESVLAQLTPQDQRSDIFAWYTLFGTAGTALGTLTCGWMVQGLQSLDDWTDIAAYQAVFLVYAALGLVKCVINMMLSSAVEAEPLQHSHQEADPESEAGLLPDEETRLLPDADSGSCAEAEPTPTSSSAQRGKPSPPPPTLGQRARSLIPNISPASRAILWRLLILFGMDSFGSGMASPSWLTYFFTTVHSLQPGTLGTLFLVTNLIATVSNLAALPLARRIGPLRTMVFTHLPSSVFLAAIPLPAPSSPAGTWTAMAFLALRACTSNMDTAPRQTFLAAAVLPAERTAVLGVVNIVKTLAQAGGIGSTGLFAERSLWVVALGGAGLMKASYDLFMLWMFVHLK
ncbi:major facilitator superfamily transporter [Microdochium trichocladiopsis]|uniref:Major facilitator superfamily transporter n=1 Tax=Microdochium trichocladiopsis TaxID=1682393 RepID=A0A9P9BRC8_9PEZI|nr:major facilitator superfamily transporter [Microdochium trichocladiopsis]KAH7032665.1 major facilitator superfamily transporter [Microdochium trichocladiopsis]